jgi:chromosome partitioning protein
MALTISIAMQKGGVGKTTTAQTLASILGLKKKKVLLLDMDSQCNATIISGVDEPDKTISDTLLEECTLKEAMVCCSLYDLLPADELLANFERIDEIKPTLLKTILAAVQSRYDFIIIDTPPALGNLLKISLMASDYVIIPTEPRPLSLRGMDALQATIETVQASNRALKVLGILLIKFNERTVLNRQLREVLDDRADQMNTTVFDTFIREGIAVPEAQAMCMSLIEYAPKSNPCVDYETFVNEFLNKLE